VASNRPITDPTQRWTLALTAVVALVIGLDAWVVPMALTSFEPAGNQTHAEGGKR